MKLLGQRILQKYKRKNKGNKTLSKAIDKLIVDLEENDINKPEELTKIRPDADKVHPDGFFFFNLSDHRSMILIELINDEATILWCGNHKTYESTFKNNKHTIRKWLKSKNYI